MWNQTNQINLISGNSKGTPLELKSNAQGFAKVKKILFNY